jgi:hypothetical protein
MLYKLPAEVIASEIFSRVGIKSIILLTKVSKSSHKNKRNIHLHLIKNDIFLFNFRNFYKIDLIRTLSESSISYELFDKMYEYIKYDKDDNVFDTRFDVGEENKKQYQINNTFTILKLLKLSINCHIKGDNPALHIRREKCCDMVTSIMKNYFTNMFFARNDSKFYTSFIGKKDIAWEHSNINLYNICENLNLMCSEKESEAFKTNLQNFDETIFRVKKYDTLKSLSTILMMFKWLSSSRFQPMNVTIYLKFIIFSYSNHLFKENIYKDMVSHGGLAEYIRDIVHTEEYNINHIFDTLLAPYFKDMIINEMTTYKINCEKYL